MFQYFDALRLLMAWCELHPDFRPFRSGRTALGRRLPKSRPPRPRCESRCEHNTVSRPSAHIAARN